MFARGSARTNDLELRVAELRQTGVSIDEDPDRVRRLGREPVNLERAEQTDNRVRAR
jgi:hypothetical protein